VAIEERDRGFGDIDEPLYRPVPTSNHLEPRRVRQMKSMSAFAYQTLSRLNVDAAAKKVAAVARKYLPTPPHRIDKNPIGEKTIRNWMKRRATGQLPVSFDDGDPFRDVYHYRPEVRAKLVLDRLERVLKALKAQID
jgi:hypothetical protein